MNLRRILLILLTAVVTGVVAFGVAGAYSHRDDSSVVVLGDSMAFGSGSAHGFGNDLDARLGGSIVGWVGGPGQGPLIDPWAANLKDMLPRVHPKFLVLDACCNGYSDSAAWRAQLEKIAGIAKGVHVIAVTTPIPESTSWFANLKSDVFDANADLRVVAERSGWELVDLAKAWPLGTPGVHAQDGLHLSDRSASEAARMIAAKIQAAQ